MSDSTFNTEKLTFSNKNPWKAKSKKSSGLPLFYKDKPTGTERPFRFKTRSEKLQMLFKGFIGSLLLYALYYFVSDGGIKSGQVDWRVRQEEVKQVFLESWNSYEEYAWGKDVFHPILGTGENMGPKPLGWMIVDSLDTLLLMGCDDEFERAKKWVKEDLDYGFDYNVNVFETTIRMLGGLLSAFHLTNDDMFLDKATDLGNALIGGFKSPSGLPYLSVNLQSGEGIKNHVDNGASSTAEVSTLQLEFKYLSKLTGESLYWEQVEKIMKILDDNKPKDGLVPIYVHPDTGKYQGRLIRLGSRGDSYYEYLLKQYLQTNNEEPIYWNMYRESVDGVKKHLVGKTNPGQLTFIGELDHGIGRELSPKMDHLVCFYGGLLAVGATNGFTLEEARKSPNWDSDKESDFKLGEELTHTCYKMYHEVPTGLSPEIAVFNENPNKDHDFFIKKLDRHNLQRPETVESLFYLYRLTKDEKYREWGYEIFQNFVKYTKIINEDGKVSYTSLDDVTSIPPRKRDNMESFWLAETLKYLYLLFDEDNKIPLDQYVFNTEAHPFPRFDMAPLFKTGWERSENDERSKIHYKGAVKESTMEASTNEEELNKKLKIDKHNPPQAAPVGKSVEDEAKEEAEKNPGILNDDKKENKEKFEKILENINP